MIKILFAEDDALIRDGLETLLSREGYHPVAAVDGQQALRLFEREKPDFVLLDIMMPNLGGYDVCRAIRKQDPLVPILFLSARGEEIDRVLGLELGADDYLVKPFGSRELVARIGAILRRMRFRAHADPTTTVSFTLDDIEVVPDQLRARRGDTWIDLGPRDVSILRLLHERVGKVIDRSDLFEICWGSSFPGATRAVDQHLSQLRRKIELDPANPRIIRTVHGAGYRYEPS